MSAQVTAVHVLLQPDGRYALIVQRPDEPLEDATRENDLSVEGVIDRLARPPRFKWIHYRDADWNPITIPEPIAREIAARGLSHELSGKCPECGGTRTKDGAPCSLCLAPSK